MSLTGAYDPSGVRGSLSVRQRGGTLLVPELPDDLGHQPIGTAEVELTLLPGAVKLTEAHLRGATNLDASGAWSAENGISVTGKAWAARRYARKLMPRGFSWLAGLFHVKNVRSDFSITGTADRLILDAGITHTAMWKYARKRVPKELRGIAAGKAPLWSRPERVAGR